MKTFCLIALVAATAAIAARAGSNTNVTSQLRVTDIYSDGLYYEWSTRPVTATYHGHVRVLGPDMKLTCALLVADWPGSGGLLSHVVAETNVAFDATNVMVDAKDPQGRTVHVTSQKAVYDYNVKDAVTNETITLTGDPQPQALVYQGTVITTNKADVIIYDRVNNSLRLLGHQHMQLYEKPDTAPVDTNSSPAATNATNPPLPDPIPGTIDNIDRIHNPPIPSQRGF
ncbi:MAG TPA: hypothetical protein VFY06_16185 [Verrucomicrobiae bacterium]|nr:hypothetical protein [Verrucomicrobiae bacterium]